MNARLTLLFSLILGIHSTATAAIFGTDDRRSVTPKMSEYSVARSTAVAILSSLHEPVDDSHLRIHTDSLDGYLCSDQKFAKDPSLSYACSGFLVAPDLVVTAGHCMVNTGETRDESEMFCEAYSWLFGYMEDETGRVNLERIPSDNLYHCRRIIYAVKDEGPPYRDYALVQLDRPVTGRPPLRLTRSAPQVREPVFMIGHPLGVPAKLSRNAFVLRNDPKFESFITNLDAFEGNSGSAVFNMNRQVTGILIGGTPSRGLIQNGPNQCHRYNTCDRSGQNCQVPDKEPITFPGFQQTGSEVQRIGPIIDLIESLSPNEAN